MYLAEWTGLTWPLFLIVAAGFAANRARLAWGWPRALLLLAGNVLMLAMSMTPYVMEGGWALILSLVGLVGSAALPLTVVDEARRSTFRRIAAGEDVPVPQWGL